jgi:hypothetical protein
MSNSSGPKMTPNVTASQGGAVIADGNFPPIDTPLRDSEPNVTVNIVGSTRVEVTVQFGLAKPIDVVIQLA